MHPITSKLILCFHQILFPSFSYSGPVDSWCSLVLDLWTFGKYFRDWPFNLQGGGGGGGGGGVVGLLFFASFRIFFRTSRELEYLFFLSRKAQFFFQNSTLGYMTKTLNQIIFFFLHQNQNIFCSNIGN